MNTLYEISKEIFAQSKYDHNLSHNQSIVNKDKKICTWIIVRSYTLYYQGLGNRYQLKTKTMIKTIIGINHDENLIYI